MFILLIWLFILRGALSLVGAWMSFSARYSWMKPVSGFLIGESVTGNFDGFDHFVFRQAVSGLVLPVQGEIS
jgi:hypothetical protein